MSVTAVIVEAMRHWRKYLILGTLLLVVCIGGVSYIVGDRLTTAAPGIVGPPPFDAPYQDVRLTSDAGGILVGWLFPGDPAAPAIALFHAIRENRKSMAARAELLVRHGYNVLAIDLPAHGESAGHRITFGVAESQGVKTSYEYLRRRFPNSKTAAIGVSLGGAASLLGNRPAAFDALVLESVYPDIDTAVANRLALKLGPMGRILSPLLTAQLKPRLGVAPAELRPVKAIQAYEGAVFIIAGDLDRHTTPADTRRLFDAAKDPKTLWMVKGGGHADLHRFAGQRYEHNILAFLKLHLRRD